MDNQNDMILLVCAMMRQLGVTEIKLGERFITESLEAGYEGEGITAWRDAIDDSITIRRVRTINGEWHESQ